MDKILWEYKLHWAEHFIIFQNRIEIRKPFNQIRIIPISNIADVTTSALLPYVFLRLNNREQIKIQTKKMEDKSKVASLIGGLMS